MVRALAKFRTAGKWIAVGSIIGLGCTQHSSGTFGQQLDIRADSTYDEGWNTPLPNGVPSEPGVFRNTVAPYLVSPGPTYVRLRAGHCKGCVINVSIKTLSDTRSLDPKSPPPGIGRPVALIKNLDHDTTEAYYGFKPGRQADYFWWAHADPNHPGLALLTMLEVPWYGGRVRAGRQEAITLCSGYQHDNSPSEGADFVEYRHPEGCTRRSSSIKKADLSLLSGGLWSALEARVTTLFARYSMISGGGWIDCNSGCCT